MVTYQNCVFSTQFGSKLTTSNVSGVHVIKILYQTVQLRKILITLHTLHDSRDLNKR